MDYSVCLPVPEHAFDAKRSGNQLTDLVKRTFCTLLTRGLKGVYFAEAATGAYADKRIARHWT